MSSLERCELILTSRCNFRCPYCRNLKNKYQGDMDIDSAKNILRIWIDNDLKNVRFSGGEPTMYYGLLELVEMCKDNGVERIAISTNGSNSFRTYSKLIQTGVNDFSISLDACCATVGNVMSGGPKCWDKVVENIKALSEMTYVSVGMVFTETNIHECLESVLFADSLGV
ncbi:MAG: radical SAM protein [Patescibacteria group bacterium]|jgi:molybdenum cofactor biosynthesis enzyme MoaA